MAREPGSDEGPDRDDLGPCPKSSQGLEEETVATIFAMSIMNAVMLKYKRAVLKHIVMPPPGRMGNAELLSHFDRLFETDALPYLSTIWKESRCFVSLEEMELAGVTTCNEGNRPLTRNMVGKINGRLERDAHRVKVDLTEENSRKRLIDLIERSAEGDKYVRRAGRIADSAEALGLIETDAAWKEAERSTIKPIRATAALDALLREVAVYKLALLRRAALVDEPDQPETPKSPETDVE